MEKLLEFIRALIQDKLGLEGLLVLFASAIGIFGWYQHHRTKILQARLEFEEERRKRATDDLEKAEKRVTEMRSHAAPPAAQQRVLIVDDHNLIRNGLQLFLTDLFPDVLVSQGSDGEDALRKIDIENPTLGCVDNQASQIRVAAIEIKASNLMSSLS